MASFAEIVAAELSKIAHAGLDAASGAAQPKKRKLSGPDLENCTPCAIAAKREAAHEKVAEFKKRMSFK